MIITKLIQDDNFRPSNGVSTSDKYYRMSYKGSKGLVEDILIRDTLDGWFSCCSSGEADSRLKFELQGQLNRMKNETEVKQ